MGTQPGSSGGWEGTQRGTVTRHPCWTPELGLPLCPPFQEPEEKEVQRRTGLGFAAMQLVHAGDKVELETADNHSARPQLAWPHDKDKAVDSTTWSLAMLPDPAVPRLLFPRFPFSLSYEPPRETSADPTRQGPLLPTLVTQT